MIDWILLRGLAREQRHFGDFPATFAARVPNARVSTLDLPGFGDQAARPSPTSVEAIVDDLRARAFGSAPSHTPRAILALSLGGMVALRWAARYPDDFARAVVVNTSSAGLSPLWQRFSPAMAARLPQLLVAAPLARERAILAVTSNRTPTDNEPVAARWAAWFDEVRPSRVNVLRQLTAAARCRPPGQLTVPLLVLASRADRLVSWRCSERLASALHAELRVHDAGGHDLSLDAPEWICDQVTQWQSS
ncbi:MAG: alpha/beta fold hydrolase [Deltaproteobacteria bacterium]|nr:alpha/beta fold hydrolase [Deltaproteobacteria bacterium]